MERIKESQGMVVTSEEGEVGEVCCVIATNRQLLVDTINQFVDPDFFDGTGDKSYLHISLSGKGCEGCSVDYHTEADVPYHSVPCTCGNPKHWLIKYEKETK